jgi:hypothetical protein
MQHLHNFADSRNAADECCVHCGSSTPDSREHTPSRILLDKPYPANLHVPPACAKCNVASSADEEYVACLVECTLHGHVDPERLSRPEVGRILREKPALAARIIAARTVDGERTSFAVEMSRVHVVLLKLARAHAAYELNEPQLGEPARIDCVPLFLMTDEQRGQFENPPSTAFWPEVGSRAMQRLAGVGDPLHGSWFVVQNDRYRFCTGTIGDTVFVRIVLSEYLGAEVAWEQD